MTSKRRFGIEKEKVYMLKNKELRVEIIWLHHDILVIGHRDRQKIMKLVARSDKRCKKVCI